ASLAGFLGARAVRSILQDGAPEDDALAAYERGYRGAFERYLRFLYFFYDHNTDPDSYFWTARRLLTHAPAELDARTSFVRLMSGGADWDALPEVLEHEHARWGDAIRLGRASALPGNDLLRVRTTERLIEEEDGGRGGAFSSPGTRSAAAIRWRRSACATSQLLRPRRDTTSPSSTSASAPTWSARSPSTCATSVPT